MIFSQLALNIVLAVGVVSVLAGCRPNLQDAQKLGFSSVEEMKNATSEGYKDKSEYDMRYKKNGFSSLSEMMALQARNYSLKKDYLDVKALTPEIYWRTCVTTNRINYAYSCRGRRMSWKVQLVSIEGNWARLKPLDEKGYTLPFELEVESKTFLKHFYALPSLGGTFEIDGLLGSRNFKRPNIDNITYASLVTPPKVASPRN